MTDESKPAAKEARRARFGGHRFHKGQSGNPGGRPKQSKSLVLLAREYTDSAIEVLVDIMEDSSAPKSARAKAAEIILDRGWGKAPQTVNVTTNPVENLSDEQQLELLRALEAFAGSQASAGAGSAHSTH